MNPWFSDLHCHTGEYLQGFPHPMGKVGWKFTPEQERRGFVHGASTSNPELLYTEQTRSVVKTQEYRGHLDHSTNHTEASVL